MLKLQTSKEFLCEIVTSSDFHKNAFFAIVKEYLNENT